MSAHHAPDWVPERHGSGIKNDGVFATWLSLLSFTFLIGTFVAANVYLRGWNPDVYNVSLGDYANMPYYATLVLLLAGLLSVFAGGAYRAGAWKRLQGLLALVAVAFTAYAVITMKLVTITYDLGPAAWTTLIGVYFLEFLMALVCLWFVMMIGFKFANRNLKSLNSWVPAATSVFLYTVMTGLLCLLVTDVVSVGEFAEWCGIRIGLIK